MKAAGSSKMLAPTCHITEDKGLLYEDTKISTDTTCAAYVLTTNFITERDISTGQPRSITRKICL
jgi:hypothetical protein